MAAFSKARSVVTARRMVFLARPCARLALEPDVLEPTLGIIGYGGNVGLAVFERYCATEGQTGLNLALHALGGLTAADRLRFALALVVDDHAPRGVPFGFSNFNAHAPAPAMRL